MDAPTGPFTCEVTLRRIRAPEFKREDKHGVTYLTARGYEIAYDTVLRFAHGVQLTIKARLVGELNQRLIIRDPSGRPVRMSGYAQGLAEIDDAEGHVLFRGRYYDSRTLRLLTGDDVFMYGFGFGPTLLVFSGIAVLSLPFLVVRGQRSEVRGQADVV